jgi:hypothetical protein
LATLEGVLSAYELKECPTLVAHVYENEQLNAVMEELIASAAYMTASARAHERGVLGKMKAALAYLARDLKNTVRRSKFKKFLMLVVARFKLARGFGFQIRKISIGCSRTRSCRQS